MKYLLLLIAAFPLFINAQIRGIITDETGLPVAGASITIADSYLGSSTNNAGEYEIKLTKAGDYILQVHKIGYQTASKKINYESKTLTTNLQLQPIQQVIETVTIRNTTNSADRIMREAIKHRKKNGQKYDRYKVDFYSKGVIKMVDLPKKIFGKEVDEDVIDDLQLDSTRSGIVYLSETMSEVALDRPNKFTETVKASKVGGDDQGYSFNSAMGTNFDFYANQVTVLNHIISPLADQAFNYYRFKLLRSFEDGDDLIHEIQVIPRRIAEPVASGSLYIIDQGWQIYAVNVAIKGSSINEPVIDSILIQQQYVYHPTDAIWAKQTQNIQFKLGIFNLKMAGQFDHVFSNYQFVSSFERGTFGKTLIKVEEQSNKLSDDFWSQNRPLVLKEDESTNYIRRDSIQQVRRSPAYLDSIDRKSNTFTANKMLFGYSHYNREKKRTIGYGLLDQVDKIRYNAVQGFVPTLNLFARQRRAKGFGGTYFNSDISYGFADQKLRFDGSLTHVLNNKARAALTLRGGSNVQQFNSSEPIAPFVNTVASLFFKENFIKLYQRDHIEFAYEQVLAPELSIFATLQYNRRSPLFINTHYSFRDKDKLFESNDPLQPENYNSAPFERHHIAKWRVGSVINPGRRVIDRPDGYQYISRPYMPTIRVQLEQGFASDHDYFFASANVREDVSWQNKGTLQLFARGGVFFDADNMSFIDFKHFNGNQTHIGSSKEYMDRFMILPYYTNSTNQRYIETHAEHHFEGFLLNKIPLLNRLGFTEVIGHHHFSIPNKPSYQEFTVGLDKIGWGKFRVFRIDYVRAIQAGDHQNGWVIGMKFLNF
ncbi:DUF5686 and carboxypeptidase regulatory-like domain-containing protein [Sphingobacterium corticis]|uniref:DUF5686 and carboxypeptidase regulatory-like domain-containing protein n=1 Tax=Sphingobacterium corticis TaxID=1812823 RepID=A0ABW5NKF9_9SPHI